MLAEIQSVEDLKKIPIHQLPELAEEIRAKIIAEYLKSLTNNDTVRVLSGEVGSTPLTPAINT